MFQFCKKEGKKMKRTSNLFFCILLCCLMVCSLSVGVYALTDAESNDNTVSAQEITLGDTIEGSIGIEYDLDYYRFTLPESGRVSFSLTSYMHRYGVFLYDADGELLFSQDGYEWNQEVGFRKDSFQFDLVAGTYYLKVSGSGSYSVGLIGGFNYVNTGNYTVSTSFLPANSTEIESNNSVADANVLSTSDSVLGQIAVNDSYDFYKIVLPESGRLKLDMTSYMQYYSITLYDIDGVQLWDVYGCEWNSTVGFRKGTHTIDLIAGTYYIKTDGYGGSSSMGDRRYNTSTGTYALAVDFITANATETEPNNLLLGANHVDIQHPVTGQIAVNDRYDFFSIDVPADCTLALDFTSYMQYYALRIYDANGTELWYSGRNEWNANVGNRNDIHSVDLTTGTYYIEVSGDSTTGTYVLALDYASDALIGNVDGNDSVDYFDAMVIMQYFAGLIGEAELNVSAADVDGTGTVDFFDAMYILQYFAGLVDTLPVES